MLNEIVKIPIGNYADLHEKNDDDITSGSHEIKRINN